MDKKFDRMNGLVNRGDMKELQRLIDCFVTDLSEEGFEVEDIAAFLGKVTRDIAIGEALV